MDTFAIKIIMDVELDGQETKQFSMEVDPLRRTKKAMKAVASRLGKEVSSLKFLVERENGKWRRLGEEEIVRDLKGAISFINIHQFQSIWYLLFLVNFHKFGTFFLINFNQSARVTKCDCSCQGFPVRRTQLKASSVTRDNLVDENIVILPQNFFTGPAIKVFWCLCK